MSTFSVDANTVYTPNTNQTAVMGKLQLGGAQETGETPLKERANGGMIEDRGGRYIQGPDGKMQGSLPAGGSPAGSGDPKGSLLDPKNLDANMEPQKTKYAKSKRANKGGIDVPPNLFSTIRGSVNSRYPKSPSGAKRTVWDTKYAYHVTTDGEGSMTVDKIVPLTKGRRK